MCASKAIRSSHPMHPSAPDLRSLAVVVLKSSKPVPRIQDCWLLLHNGNRLQKVNTDVLNANSHFISEVKAVSSSSIQSICKAVWYHWQLRHIGSIGVGALKHYKNMRRVPSTRSKRPIRFNHSATTATLGEPKLLIKYHKKHAYLWCDQEPKNIFAHLQPWRADL